jgi:NTP pyrophosphatase (non-canonical NTP hydrolase)
MSQDSWADMRAAVQAFHDKHRFRERGGEALVYRVALMTEELGEISEAITKGKGKDALAEECADLLILLVGTAIAADLDLNATFWSKMDELMQREAKMVDGRVRVSRFES